MEELRLKSRFKSRKILWVPKMNLYSKSAKFALEKKVWIGADVWCDHLRFRSSQLGLKVE